MELLSETIRCITQFRSDEEDILYGGGNVEYIIKSEVDALEHEYPTVKAKIVLTITKLKLKTKQLQRQKGESNKFQLVAHA